MNIVQLKNQCIIYSTMGGGEPGYDEFNRCLDLLADVFYYNEFVAFLDLLSHLLTFNYSQNK